MAIKNPPIKDVKTIKATKPNKKKPYPVTKIIGVCVLVITEILVIATYCRAFFDKTGGTMAQLIDVTGMQLIIFGAFWGLKGLADNVKIWKGRE
jgi:uncharacterized membrane protein YkgB